MSRDCIKVVCRLRPENKDEIRRQDGICMTHTDDSVKIIVSNQILNIIYTQFIILFV